MPADRVYEDFGSFAPPSIYDRLWLVLALTALGRFSEASEVASEAIRLAAPTHRALTVGFAQIASSLLHFWRGDWTKAHTQLEPLMAALGTGIVGIFRSYVIAPSVVVLAHLREKSEALTRILEGEQLSDRAAARGLVGALGSNYSYLGQACLVVGRVDEARRLADRAIEFCPSHAGFRAQTLHLLGDIATHPDRFDAERGETHYREALALAEPRGMRPLVAHCHLGLAKLYGRTGKRLEADEHFATATSMYREMGMTYWLEEAEEETRELM